MKKSTCTDFNMTLISDTRKHYFFSYSHPFDYNFFRPRQEEAAIYDYLLKYVI